MPRPRSSCFAGARRRRIKLRLLAERLLTDYGELVYEEMLPPRATFDHLLLTAHQRVDVGGDTVEQ